MTLSARNQSMIISFLVMRRIIGVLGIGLPVIVITGAFVQSGLVLQGSISTYYYTSMRDFFVGLLSCVSLFLMTYKGYESIDNVVTNMSGIFALGIVVFPTAMNSGEVVRVGLFLIDDNRSEYLHTSCAALFFLLSAYNSIFLFTKHGHGPVSREKKKRNKIYVACGIVIVISVLCVAVYKLFLTHTVFTRLYPILIFNTIALFAFGVSWWVKGHTMFKDKITI